MKKILLVCIFLFCSFTYGQCSKSQASSKSKTSSYGTRSLHVTVKNTGKYECKLLLQIKTNDGYWSTVVSQKILKPGDSYTGSQDTKSSKYRWALVEKNESKYTADKKSLWKTN